jgi:TP901 family phage tail tape measure protein
VATGQQQRDLRINLSANTAGLEKGLQRAERAMEGYQRSVEDAQNAVARLEQELQADMERTLAEVEERSAARSETWQAMGRGMLVAGAGIAAGLGMASAAAIQWESDWAGVTKVLDATPEELSRLEDGLRGLAMQIPVTHTELASIAAAAGQLGVESEHILQFTQTIAAMGVATDLTVEDAAMQMARFSTIMGTPQDDVDQLGAAIVELGNNSAATESEILTMAMRIAGAGNTIGISEGEVLGFAAAMASVGMEAEAGGSAVSRVLLGIDTAVSTSGAELVTFARVAGMSAEEYTQAWEEDAAGATQLFIAGLGEMNDQGKNVTGTLNELGLGEIVVRDALLRMAGASDMVSESLQLGNQGWEENTALVEEAAARYETTESKIQIARNAITETGIAIGEALLPMLGAAAERITDYGIAFQGLDEDQQQWVAGIGGGAGALALLTGALVTVGPRVIEFRGQMQELATGGATRVQRGIGSLATFMTGPYGAAIGAVLALGALWLDQKARQVAAEQEWANALTETGGVIDGSIAAMAAQKLEETGLLALSEELGVQQGVLTQAYVESGEARDALTMADQWAQAAKQGLLDTYDQEGQQIRDLNAALEVLFGTGTTWRDLTSEQWTQVQNLNGGLGEQIDTMNAGAEAQAAANAETETAATAYLTASEAADQFTQSVNTANQAVADAISAELDYNATMLRVTETVTENAGATDRHTEAGIANHRSILDLIAAGERETQTMIANEASTEDLEAQKRKLRADLETLRTTVGLTDEQFAEYDEMLRSVETEIDTAIEVRANGTWAGVSTSARSGNPFAGASTFATGGPVFGAGGPTEDKIPALLSNNEHVWTAAEVAAAGGHEAVSALRALVKSGSLKLGEEPQAFARGGAVLPRSARIVDDHDEETRINIQRLFAATTAGVANDMAAQYKKWMQSGGSVVAAWRSQTGVPYSWGGGGPGGPGYGFAQGAGIRGFDCSSLMQYGWSKVGVSLPRVTYDQINYGRPVSKGSERPGDLVFPHRGHVAGVSGPGRVIHAPQTGSFVHERAMYPNPIAIRRPGRFDTGGMLRHGELAENASRRPERILSPRQTDSFERLVGLLGGTTVPAQGSGPQEVHYHVHHVPGFSTERDLQRAEEHRQQRVRAGRRG